MLNGLAPILMFSFPPKVEGLSGTKIPVTENFFTALGTPIPLYLDEKLTGIVVDNESKAVEIEIEADQTVKELPSVAQRGLDSIVTINMKASRNAPILAALLAFSDQIFLKAVANNYRVSYLNGSTLVFNGLLKSFTHTVGEDDDLVRISMVLSKANQLPPTPTATTPQVPMTTGTIPVTG